MTVTYNEPEIIDQITWRLSWTSDRAAPVPFRLYADGRKIAEFTSATQSGEQIVSVPFNGSKYFEVLDKACSIPQLAFPPNFTIAWQGVANAVKYRIDEFVSAAWTERETILDLGQGAFKFVSRRLEDTTSHQFRVVAIDAADNEATALSLTALMVRRPAIEQEVTVTYSGGNAFEVGVTS